MCYAVIMFRTVIASLFVGSLFMALIRFFELEPILDSADLGWLHIDWLPMQVLIGVMGITILALAVHSPRK